MSKNGPITRTRLAVLGVAIYLAALLAADQLVGLRGQYALGALTWLVLALALRPLSSVLRVQTLLVVAVATCGELVGSIVWGLYTYRLENLPSFVPPAHGLVYLGGVALAGSLGRRAQPLVWIALAGVVAWGLAGVTVLPREDAAGAAGAAALAVFLLRGRAPTIYAGVFFVVAGLELYGTALGTWTWAETAPGTPVSQGNPPSGIASGYVLFDIAALRLAGALTAGVSTGRFRRTPGEAARPDIGAAGGASVAQRALGVMRRERRSRAPHAAPLPEPARSA